MAVLRRFNRCYTQRIGVLNDSYLDSGRSLGLSRVLFEIGVADAVGVGDLRRRLGLDSGYLSRMLRALEADGLVTVTPDSIDARQRHARLTRDGVKAWRQLDERSERVASTLMEPLSSRQRELLAESLAAAERLLRAASVTTEVVAPESDVAQSAMQQYFAELDRRFPTGFDPGGAGAAHDTDSMRAPRGAFVVMRDDNNVIGCGGVQRIDDATGEIKRMWIHDEWRGLGLGRRLLVYLETVVDGLDRIVLDTNSSLREAITMYEQSGYTATQRYNDNPYAQHWFEKRVTRSRGKSVGVVKSRREANG